MSYIIAGLGNHLCPVVPYHSDRLSTNFHHLLPSIGVEISQLDSALLVSFLVPPTTTTAISYREVPSSFATFLSNSFSGLLSGSWQKGRNGWGR